MGRHGGRDATGRVRSADIIFRRRDVPLAVPLNTGIACHDAMAVRAGALANNFKLNSTYLKPLQLAIEQ